MARETRLSETTFVQSATQAGADYRNRIWTIAGELPFAGHPSLGTAVAVARARGDRSARYVQETGAGLQPVGVELAEDGRSASAWMLQEPAVFGDEVDAAKAMAAAGLFPEDAHPTLPPQVVSTGVAHLIAPVAADSVLARAAPDHVALGRLLDDLQAVVIYLAVVDADAGRAHARAFSPAVAGGEDPATGLGRRPALCLRGAADRRAAARDRPGRRDGAGVAHRGRARGRSRPRRRRGRRPRRRDAVPLTRCTRADARPRPRARCPPGRRRRAATPSRRPGCGPAPRGRRGA